MMGIGRREFIKMFAASLAAIAAEPADAASLIDDYYLNRKLGVGFTRPPGWSFGDVREMGVVQQGQLLAIDDEAVARELLDSMELPFVSVLGHGKTPDSFAPSAQFYLVDDIPELEELSDLFGQLESLVNAFDGAAAPEVEQPRTVKKLHEDMQACQELLRSFEVLSPPRALMLSECEAAEYTASYLFEHAEMPRPLRVRARTIYVAHRIAAYLIRLVDSPDSSSEDAFDFEPFVRSIRLA